MIASRAEPVADARGGPSWLAPLASRAVAAADRALRRARARRHLARLDDHLLRDIGLTRDGIDAAVSGRRG